MNNPQMRALSLGAGVQSTALALMAKDGIVPMPDIAIFADTQWEPRAVYEHLAWLESVLPFPVHRVTAGNLREAAYMGQNVDGDKFDVIPWFTLDAQGNRGMGSRQCTSNYKLRPIRKEIRRLYGNGPVETQIGISTDEAHRMKPSNVKYIVNVFPLIDLGLSRKDCERYVIDNYGVKSPKSSCVGCPFHSDNQWRALTPDEMRDAIEIDRAIRTNSSKPGKYQYMHKSLRPLETVDFSTMEERGQLDMFGNECEGMCGL